jgi:autotransporter-associated beta strand protein
MMRQAKRLNLERLEDRAVPANLVWTGDVDGNWATSNAGNTNWAFDFLPHNGDSLIFPAAAQNHTNTNNLTGLVVANLTVQSRPFTISGNAITLTGNFLDSTGQNTASGFLHIPLRLSSGSHTFTISAPASGNSDTIDGGISEAGGGTASVVVDGDGSLHFGGPGNTYTGATTVSGLLSAVANPGVAIPGDVLVNRDLFYSNLGPGNQIADTAAVSVAFDGALFLEGQSDTVGPLTVASGGRLDLIDGFNNHYAHLTTADISLASGSILLMEIQDSQSPSDRITVNGTVQLGGTLGLGIGSVVPAVGAAITLIDNDANDAVVGTFNGLPQGAIFSTLGRLFSIDYAGGTGNDVVVTRLPSLQVAGTQVNDGSAQRSRITSLKVTFNAQVTFASTPAAAFTLVRNSDNASVAFTATAAVIGGVTVVTLANYGGGSATQFLSLADGRYTLTALASQLSLAGQPLDGNGDGTPGDNYTFGDAQGLFRFFGDINGDRHVDIADFGIFSQSIFNSGNYIAAFDFNSDGHVDIQDFGQFSVRLFSPLP